MADGNEHTTVELYEALAIKFGLTKQDREERLHSGRRRFNNYVRWASLQLKKQGLLESRGRGRFQITEKGIEALKSSTHVIVSQEESGIRTRRTVARKRELSAPTRRTPQKPKKAKGRISRKSPSSTTRESDPLKRKEIEIKAREELLPEIYPHVDLANFSKNNPDMKDKCCRLIFHMDLWRIANFHMVHGESLKFINNAINGDIELNIPDDPLWGWDMTNPSAGFPCINLEETGCTYHPDGKPYRCKMYPEREIHIHNNIKTCSYSFAGKFL